MEIKYMEFLNQKVIEDLAAGIPISLDLGSGGIRIEGFYGVDHLPLPGVDIVANLNLALDKIPDNSVTRIRSNHALEHVQEFLPLMREIHRICRSDARIEIVVPHFSNVYGFSDPTHVRFFGLYSMYYFVSPEQQPRQRRVPAFYSDTRFTIDKIWFEFYRIGWFDTIFASLVSRVVNRSLACQDFYERRLSSLFHARQLVFRMRPVKDKI